MQTMIQSLLRSLPLRLLAALVLVGSCPCGTTLAQSAQDGQSSKPLNFVVILVDDLGWADLGCYGSAYYETPHLDRMSEEGIRFTNGYAACAVCSPTRLSLQTGLYPARTAITDWIRAKFQSGTIPPGAKNPTPYVRLDNGPLACPPNGLFMELEYETIAERLKKAGYVTGHVGKWHLGQEAHSPEKQGYDFNFAGCDLGQPPSYFDPYLSKDRNRSLVIPPSVLVPRKTGEYLTDRESDEAVGFIETNRDRPFFLHLAHYAVHTPLMGKPDLVEKYARKGEDSDFLQKNAVYAAMIESVDESTGKILRTLDRLGLAEQTVVVFTSDNGGLIGSTNNEPLRSGKGFPYEGGIRVPWIFRCPTRIPSGIVSEEPIITCDLFPTLADWAGVPVESVSQTTGEEAERVDGKSLVPVLTSKGPFSGIGRSLFWHFPHYRFENDPGQLRPYSIIRRNDWKLIKYYTADEPDFELYHLGDDWGERVNRAEQEPDLVRSLDTELQHWLESVNARLPEKERDK
ncbi:MAG: sulfatase [Thermoguttaceae bacterium]